jgi:hypothetical protein
VIRVAAFLCGFAITRAFAASIGLFSDPDCTACNLNILAGEIGTLYVVVSTEGLPDNEHFVSAEFRITGLPDGWIATSTPEPSAFAFGDPFGPGANIGFGIGQRGDCIPIYSVVIASPSPATDVRLHVSGRLPPGDPAMNCPRIAVACEIGPCDIIHCVSGGHLLINSSEVCSVATKTHTWAAVKGFYK